MPFAVHFIMCLDLFVQDSSYLAACCVGNPHPGVLVDTGGGNKGEPFAVGTPFVVLRRNIILDRSSMIIRRHLEADHTRSINLDNDPMDHCHHAVARKGILPCLKHGMVHLCFDEIHLADVSLILLLCRDLPGIGRPEKNRPFTFSPSCVIGRVSEILNAIRGKLTFFFCRYVSDPKVPIADERLELAVRGLDGCASRSSSSKETAACTLSCGIFRRG